MTSSGNLELGVKERESARGGRVRRKKRKKNKSKKTTFPFVFSSRFLLPFFCLQLDAKAFLAPFCRRLCSSPLRLFFFQAAEYHHATRSALSEAGIGQARQEQRGGQMQRFFVVGGGVGVAAAAAAPCRRSHPCPAPHRPGRPRLPGLGMVDQHGGAQVPRRSDGRSGES